MLSFVGITDLGTPVWVNKYVAEADFKIALGRIYPHCTYGYEGGYKMIVPGVASFETIIRDHSLNFSPRSDYGILRNNPSRGEADAVGRMVGLDFLVNFVINWDGRPVAAFGGSVEAVFPAGVALGQRKVWSCTTGGKPADITILCNPDMADLSLSNNPTYYIGLAMAVTKPDGIVISTMDYVPQKDTFVAGHNLDAIAFGELIRLHEQRDWHLDKRQVQHALKSVRSVFYKRRIFEFRTQRLLLVSNTYPNSCLEKWQARQFPTIQEAYDAAAAGKSNPTVLALPDAKHTLPLMDYDF
jgi:nickel-dependent lactate racemase